MYGPKSVCISHNMRNTFSASLLSSLTAFRLLATDISLQTAEEHIESLATCLLSGEHAAAQAAIAAEKFISDGEKHPQLIGILWIHIFRHVVSNSAYKPETPGHEMLYSKGRHMQPLIYNAEVYHLQYNKIHGAEIFTRRLCGVG